MQTNLLYTITKTLPQHEDHTGQLTIHVRSKEQGNPEQLTFTWTTHYKCGIWYLCKSRLAQNLQNIYELFPILPLLNKIDEAGLTKGSGVQEVIDLLDASNIQHAVLAEITKKSGEIYKGYITAEQVRSGKLESNGYGTWHEFTLEQLKELTTQLIEEKYTKIPWQNNNPEHPKK
jgi:hypothetical protein